LNIITLFTNKVKVKYYTYTDDGKKITISKTQGNTIGVFFFSSIRLKYIYRYLFICLLYES